MKWRPVRCEEENTGYAFSVFGLNKREADMTTREQIDTFLAAKAFGVAGASSRRDKYGNKVLRCYLQNGKKAIPIHPAEKEIEGVPVVAQVADLPDDVESLSIVTPPQITEKIVEAALARGIRNLWMQPGAESPAAVEAARKAGANVIADGSCLLVTMGYHDH